MAAVRDDKSGLVMQPDESWHSVKDSSKACMVLEVGKSQTEEELEEKRMRYFRVAHIMIVILVFLGKDLRECWVRFSC